MPPLVPSKDVLSAPLVTAADFQTGQFADLARDWDGRDLAQVMIEATRACETETDRRLAPFTGLVEHQRAEGIDPDEYGGTMADMPLDLPGTLGRSYASAMGSGGSQVRHCWLHEHAARYSDMWVYADVQITLQRSWGGNQVAIPLTGPEVDTGHVWFNLGTWLPVGSRIQVIYSGGYQTVPGDLARACKYMAASILARELNPMQQQQHHDPSGLEAAAASWLAPYARD